MDKELFRAYDIRGEYPTEINQEMAEKIGIAFQNAFNLKKVAVGRDGRIGSPELERGFTSGLLKAGASVTHIGLVSTDMIYFAAGFFDYDAVAIVTASHMSKENNGFKFALRGALPVGGDQGLYKMGEMVSENKLITCEVKGSEDNREIYDEYVTKLTSLIDKDKIKPFKIVVDAGNGVGGYIFEKIAQKLPVEIIPLFSEVDGNFPNHQPNPIEEKNLVDAQKMVIAKKADLGLVFDGDGDRVFFIDEKGKAVSSTLITAMIVKKLLKKYPNSKILYDLRCGWIIKETIEKYGGRPSVTKVGHSFVKEQMRKEDGIFAGELSGHYYFKDLYYADSGILTSLVVLELISEDGRELSETVKEFDKYFLSGEINSEVSDKAGKMLEIKKKYSDGKVSELDGISIEYPEWRFNVRPSNNDPVFRLNVEAKTKELMEEKRDELLELIRV